MTPIAEKRLLQIAIVAAGAFSLFFGLASVVRGASVLLPGGAPAPVDLDSHFRYLSGIFLGAILLLYSCVPGIEAKGARLRLVGGLVVCGGLARLAGVFADGLPGGGHVVGLALELVVTPLLLWWQTRVARQMSASSTG